MPASIRNYAIVTSAYWGFTLTDGALRMLVLLHFHTLGYTPFELAFQQPERPGCRSHLGVVCMPQLTI